jgi:hypothetical protein
MAQTAKIQRRIAKVDPRLRFAGQLVSPDVRRFLLCLSYAYNFHARMQRKITPLARFAVPIFS